MGAVRAKTFADLRRRRLQTLVIAAVLFLASAAATLALNILVESHAPFDRAFAAANGAHLIVDYDGAIEARPARGDLKRAGGDRERRSVARGDRLSR